MIEGLINMLLKYKDQTIDKVMQNANELKPEDIKLELQSALKTSELINMIVNYIKDYEKNN